MDIKKYMIGISLGYIFGILLIYFIFDYFSWAFALGSLAGVGLLGIILKMLKK